MATDFINIDDPWPTKIPRHSVFTMIAVSFAMSFLFAITFVIVMTLTLPKTDGAYGQMPFEDPLVFPVMSLGATFAALLVSMPFYFTCRSLPLGRSGAIIVGVTMAELLIVTPINSGLGFFGSFLAFVVGLILTRVFCNSPKHSRI